MTRPHEPLSSLVPPTLSTPVVLAHVQTGVQETRYRRAGHGRPVLLLLGAPHGDHEALFTRLAEEFRVFEPEAVSVIDDWEGWLRGVIDGLGLVRPALVADLGTLAPAEAFARQDPDRVGPVLAAGAGDPDDLCSVLHRAFAAQQHEY